MSHGDHIFLYNIFLQQFLFEDISLELESFYTQAQLQREDDQVYEGQNTMELAAVFSVTNDRFRKSYSFLVPEAGNCHTRKPGSPEYAGVRNVTVRNIHCYADEKILSNWGRKCLRVCVRNILPNSEFSGLRLENVRLNGVKLERADLEVSISGCEENVLAIV